MKQSRIRASWILATVFLAAAAQVAVDPPHIELNAATGLIEAVDSTWSGNNYNVRFTEGTVAGEMSYSLPLTTNPANDLDPRIACTAKGDVVVVWWRDLTTDAIVCRKRSIVTGAWSPEKLLGVANESGSRPRVVDVGNDAWVAYQIQKNQTRAVGAQVIEDDSEPTRTIVATTSYSGNLDIQIMFESGNLWITWIDSASRVGYSEYNPTTELWTSAAVESFASDSIAAARARIRARILGN